MVLEFAFQVSFFSSLPWRFANKKGPFLSPNILKITDYFLPVKQYKAMRLRFRQPRRRNPDKFRFLPQLL